MFGLLITLTFIIPDYIIYVDYSVVEIEKIIKFSLSALAFIIAMYTFGRGVYTEDDFATLYIRDINAYYEYISDYFFAAFNWIMIILFSVLKLTIIVDFDKLIWEFFKIIYVLFLLLALICTLGVTIKNVNRVSNKVYIKAFKRNNS